MKRIIINSKILITALPLIVAAVFIILFILKTNELTQFKSNYTNANKSYVKKVEGLITQNDSSNKLLKQNKIKYDKTVKEYESKIKGLSAKIINLNILLRQRKYTEPNNINLSDWNIEGLTKKGLSNPIVDIVSDLIKHKELIPYKGVLGGTMDFYEREVWILNKKWVFAYFEDGHYGGYLLLEYNVTDDGKILWKVITDMKD